jgi:hypothetical protein
VSKAAEWGGQQLWVAGEGHIVPWLKRTKQIETILAVVPSSEGIANGCVDHCYLRMIFAGLLKTTSGILFQLSHSEEVLDYDRYTTEDVLQCSCSKKKCASHLWKKKGGT